MSRPGARICRTQRLAIGSDQLMAFRLSGTRSGGIRISDSIKLGPLRLWISKPISKGRNGRRRTRSGWSIKL